jgi:phosphohistidine phosphatase SixA
MSTETPMSAIYPVDVQQEARKVIIDVRRHPDKKGDAITELGERQIRLVASRDHGGLDYRLFGCSGAERTNQTIRAMMNELGVSADTPVLTLPGLHYGPAEAVAGITDDDFASAEQRVIARCETENRLQILSDWHEELPLYSKAAQAMMTATLMNLACELADLADSVDSGETPRALLVSHSPMCELAVTDLNFPRLAVSAGVSYTLVVEKGQARITEFVLLDQADDSCVTAAAPSLMDAKK